MAAYANPQLYLYTIKVREYVNMLLYGKGGGSILVLLTSNWENWRPIVMHLCTTRPALFVRKEESNAFFKSTSCSVSWASENYTQCIWLWWAQKWVPPLISTMVILIWLYGYMVITGVEIYHITGRILTIR